MSDAEEVQFKEMFSLILAGLAGLAILFLVVALTIGGSQGPYVPAEMTHAEAVAQRIQPLGQINMGGPKIAEGTPAAADEGSGDKVAALDTGAQVYDAVCSACHATGVLDAPKFGSTTDWKPRFEQHGLETLYSHAIHGFNAMPAKGGMASLSDEQVKKAVNYLLGEAGLGPKSSS